MRNLNLESVATGLMHSLSPCSDNRERSLIINTLFVLQESLSLTDEDLLYIFSCAQGMDKDSDEYLQMVIDNNR